MRQSSPTWAALRYMVLPAVSLGFNQSALIARIARSCMVEVLQQDYVRTARAKGLSQRVVAYVHGLGNALVPVVTVIGVTIAILVRVWGGDGDRLQHSRDGPPRRLGEGPRDYPVVRGSCSVTAAVLRPPSGSRHGLRPSSIPAFATTRVRDAAHGRRGRQGDDRGPVRDPGGGADRGPDPLVPPAAPQPEAWSDGRGDLSSSSSWPRCSRGGRPRSHAPRPGAAPEASEAR